MTKQRILFIDDEPNVLDAYRRSLRGECQDWLMEFASCPFEAWHRIQTEPFDAIVTDVRMPGLTGLQLLQKVKENPGTSELQVIIVTGEADRKLKRQALDADAADLLNKPVDSNDLIARLRSVLRIKRYADELKQYTEQLERRVQERTADLVASQIDILWRLGKAAEFRDEETGNHVIRVGGYSRAISRALNLDDTFTENLFLATPLHDIGKIGIPDSILLKPGKLSNDEWGLMRQHCQIGVSILSDECKFMHVARRYSDTTLSKCVEFGSNPVIEMAATIAGTHHEKWNGNGYPYRLEAEAIPLCGRIVAIADVYDALRSERPYKPSFSVERSVDILRESSGSHFDPDVVTAFFDAFDDIQEIEREFSDLSGSTCETSNAETPVACE
jgi:putative two-component system response regulator